MLHDIDREATKIPALSSGKMDKYKYPTGKRRLPSDQGRIIEQAKITYSLLEKASEKQTKTIEEQGEKQIRAIEDNEKQLDNNIPGNKLLLSKEREIFKNIYNKRLNKIDELSKKVDYANLKFIVNSTD